ncbi:MAG: diguanylate cyclase, partial [Gammaproteobacteria bacterium]|nr:diguanylate cyclase [Gammaproteobacteria bacterium]
MINPRQRASDQIHGSTPLALLDVNSYTNHYAEDFLAVHGDGVIGINKNGNIKFINKIACKLTGWLHDDVKGKKIEKIFQLGNITSPLSELELIKSVIDSAHLFGPVTHHTIKTKNNADILVDFSLSPLDEDTVILMFHSVTTNSQPRSLLYQVSHDPLTRLNNRKTIQQTISRLHEDYKKAGKTYSIFLLNIDRFKLINDCYGHDTGDQLLQLIADRILFYLRDKDNVGRWAGEEFICLMPDADMKTACKIAQRLCNEISNQAFLTDRQKISITASIGIANFPLDGESPDELYSIADATLYEAKKNGRNRIHSSQQVTGHIYSIGSKLEKALNENRITPVYQPIFELTSGKKVAEEALARIQDKNGSLIEASEFIDAAVKLQMVHRIDYQIIKKMISRCTENFIKTKNSLPHFVNVSADLLRRPQLVKEIIQFAKNKCEEKPVVIEITEQELIGDKDEIKVLLAPFIDFGMPLAIDDFGSGYSSLTYLADLPISYLKFDGELIKRVAHEDRARKIING